MALRPSGPLALPSEGADALAWLGPGNLTFWQALQVTLMQELHPVIILLIVRRPGFVQKSMNIHMKIKTHSTQTLKYAS